MQIHVFGINMSNFENMSAAVGHLRTCQVSMKIIEYSQRKTMKCRRNVVVIYKYQSGQAILEVLPVTASSFVVYCGFDKMIYLNI